MYKKMALLPARLPGTGCEPQSPTTSSFSDPSLLLGGCSSRGNSAAPGAQQCAATATNARTKPMLAGVPFAMARGASRKDQEDETRARRRRISYIAVAHNVRGVW